MLDFMRANIGMFIAGGAVLLLAILGVVVGVISKGRWADRGLISRGGHKLHWRRKDLPIAVWYPVGFPDWAWRAFRRVREHLYAKVGVQLFDVGTEEPRTDPDEEDFEDTLPRGAIYIRIGDNPREGSTKHSYDKRNGEIHSAIVEITPQAGIAWPVTLHEVGGHVLGLDHDELRESIMHPVLQEQAQYLTESDIKRLRKTYG